MSLDWSLHDQESRQKVDEDPPHPGGHQVGLGRPEVDVEHNNGHTNAERYTFSCEGVVSSEVLICVFEEKCNHQSNDKRRGNYPGIRKSRGKKLYLLALSPTHGFLLRNGAGRLSSPTPSPNDSQAPLSPKSPSPHTPTSHSHELEQSTRAKLIDKF